MGVDNQEPTGQETETTRQSRGQSKKPEGLDFAELADIAFIMSEQGKLDGDRVAALVEADNADELWSYIKEWEAKHIGIRVRKKFGRKYFHGRVVGGDVHYHVEYEDGDEEDMSGDELEEASECFKEWQQKQNKPSRKEPRPRKQPREEQSAKEPHPRKQSPKEQSAKEPHPRKPTRKDNAKEARLRKKVEQSSKSGQKGAKRGAALAAPVRHDRHDTFVDAHVRVQPLHTGRSQQTLEQMSKPELINLCQTVCQMKLTEGVQKALGTDETELENLDESQLIRLLLHLPPSEADPLAEVYDLPAMDTYSETHNSHIDSIRKICRAKFIMKMGRTEEELTQEEKQEMNTRGMQVTISTRKILDSILRTYGYVHPMILADHSPQIVDFMLSGFSKPPPGLVDMYAGIDAREKKSQRTHRKTVERVGKTWDKDFGHCFPNLMAGAMSEEEAEEESIRKQRRKKPKQHEKPETSDPRQRKRRVQGSRGGLSDAMATFPGTVITKVPVRPDAHVVAPPERKKRKVDAQQEEGDGTDKDKPETTGTVEDDGTLVISLAASKAKEPKPDGSSEDESSEDDQPMSRKRQHEENDADDSEDDEPMSRKRQRKENDADDSEDDEPMSLKLQQKEEASDDSEDDQPMSQKPKKPKTTGTYEDDGTIVIGLAAPETEEPQDLD